MMALKLEENAAYTIPNYANYPFKKFQPRKNHWEAYNVNTQLDKSQL